jgi:hypothetical protein
MRALVTVSVAKRTRRGVCHKDFFRIGAEGKVRAIMAFLQATLDHRNLDKLLIEVGRYVGI